MPPVSTGDAERAREQVPARVHGDGAFMGDAARCRRRGALTATPRLPRTRRSSRAPGEALDASCRRLVRRDAPPCGRPTAAAQEPQREASFVLMQSKVWPIILFAVPSIIRAPTD